MDLKATTRRRGADLESAILSAAWEQLIQFGYSNFTFESVAARAGTSRPVLYRRWPNRAELMLATIEHAGAFSQIDVPDTGDLRLDAVTLLHRLSEGRSGLAAVLSAQLAEYFRETGTSLADLRNVLRRGPRSGFQIVLDQAAARGEVDLEKLTPRITDLPVTLARHELLMTLRALPKRTIDEIVDDVWLPLLRARGVLL